MLIVAFACFLALLVVWLLAPGAARAESSSGSLVAAEATGD